MICKKTRLFASALTAVLVVAILHAAPGIAFDNHTSIASSSADSVSTSLYGRPRQVADIASSSQEIIAPDSSPASPDATDALSVLPSSHTSPTSSAGATTASATLSKSRWARVKSALHRKLKPKPASYHRFMAHDNAQGAWESAGDVVVALPAATACGLAGGLIRSPACALHCALIKGDGRGALMHMAAAAAKPGFGVYSGCAFTVASLVELILAASRTAYHGSLFPIAKAYEAVVGAPSHERRVKYDFKILNYLHERAQTDLELRDLRDKFFKILLGPSFRSRGFFPARAPFSRIYPLSTPPILEAYGDGEGHHDQ